MQLAREVAAAVAPVEDREREIISTLMRAAESRDTDTGDHIARVSASVGRIARALGLAPDECRLVSLAATMSDVGKIAVPDAILLKPGLLIPNLTDLDLWSISVRFGGRPPPRGGAGRSR